MSGKQIKSSTSAQILNGFKPVTVLQFDVAVLSGEVVYRHHQNPLERIEADNQLALDSFTGITGGSFFNHAPIQSLFA